MRPTSEFTTALCFILSFTFCDNSPKVCIQKQLVTEVSNYLIFFPNSGHATHQAVSCWHPTLVAWVRPQVRSCGICGRQSGHGTSFLCVSVSLPIHIH
jgi:hypothetical protein